MKLRRWDIVKIPAADNDSAGHPGVVLSPEDMLDDEKQLRFNVLVGTKKQPAEKARQNNVVLNEDDGLSFQTLVDCSLVYMVRKSQVKERLGVVAYDRRQEIKRKVRAHLGLG